MVFSGHTTFPPQLSKEEEKKCLEQYKTGSRRAKDTLIERNMRLVAHIAKKYNFKENEDLISIGTIGLIKAIASFDDSKGTRLATYAARCIDNEILMSLRARRKYGGEIYLQDSIGTDKEGNDVTIEDRLADESYSIDEQVALKMRVKVLYDKISTALNEREKEIVALRYGLWGGDELTQREISEMLGISRSYVSRIEKKALKKLHTEISESEGP